MVSALKRRNIHCWMENKKLCLHLYCCDICSNMKNRSGLESYSQIRLRSIEYPLFSGIVSVKFATFMSLIGLRYIAPRLELFRKLSSPVLFKIHYDSAIPTVTSGHLKLYYKCMISPLVTHNQIWYLSRDLHLKKKPFAMPIFGLKLRNRTSAMSIFGGNDTAYSMELHCLKSITKCSFNCEAIKQERQTTNCVITVLKNGWKCKYIFPKYIFPKIHTVKSLI